MAFSNNDALFSRGMELLKSNNLSCIQVFEECMDDRSRAQLAKIYFKGFQKIEIDYDKALSYTANNNHYLAVSIECEIRVFERKEEEYYSIAFSRLSALCNKFQNNPHVNKLLSRMLLQGLGTEPDYQEACRLQPKLRNRDYFRFQTKYCSDDVRKELITQLEKVTSEIPDCYCFIGDLYGQMDDFDKGCEYYLKAIDSGILAYDSIIKYLLKSNKQQEALEYAKRWYAIDRCPASANAFAGVKIELESPLSEYIHIIDEFKNDPICLRKALYATYINKEEKLYDKLIEYVIQNDMPVYDLIARHYGSRGDYDNAIEYLLKDYNYCRDWDAFRFSESATNLFTCIHDIHRECDVSLAHEIYRCGRLEDRHHVGCILISETDSESKELGRKLLESASYKGFDKSTIKLLEITQNADEGSSTEMLKSRLQDIPSDKYIFNMDDATETIEAKYDTLPQTYRINALVELCKRYYYGKKGTDKDDVRAFKYVNAYLMEADKESDHRYVGMNALKGAMIYKHQCLENDDELAFNLMYPCRNTFPFLNYVAEAMLTGRGTVVDIDAGITLLNSNHHCQCVRRLSSYYEKGKYVEANPDTSFKYTKSLILEFDPKREDIERFIRLVDLIGDEPTSIDTETYTHRKAAFLFHQASNEKNPLLQLRLYDFSRRLGNTKAACKEANILRREYRLSKVAYSILSEYCDDRACITLLDKYPEQDRVIVDVESELKKLFGNKQVKFLLDGTDAEIQDSYDSTFFVNRNSFRISHVLSPITVEISELNFITDTLTPDMDNIVDLNIVKINELLLLSNKPVVKLIIKANSTNKLLATTSIKCSGTYELIGTNSLMSTIVFKTRFHLEDENGLTKSKDYNIEKLITEVDTDGFNKIVIEEERAGAWVQSCILNIPDLRINPTGESFLKIYIRNNVIVFQKNDFSGYVNDDPFIEQLNSIIEMKICYFGQLPEGLSTKTYVIEARKRIIDYLCKQQAPIITNHIARIKPFDESFAYDLYDYALKIGKDIAPAKRLFLNRNPANFTRN